MKRIGWNKDNYVEEASKLYKEEVGKTFGLEKCVVVLHKLPKFDPMVSGTEDSSSQAVAGSKFLADNTSDDENYADTKTDDDDGMSKRTNRSSTGSNKKTRKVNNSEPAQGSKVSRPGINPFNKSKQCMEILPTNINGTAPAASSDALKLPSTRDSKKGNKFKTFKLFKEPAYPKEACQNHKW